jgi:ribokinase
VFPLKVDVVDTTGAGDAFVGNFAAALDAGLAPEEALRRASVAGSLACTAVGAQEALPHLADVEARLAEVPPATRL